MTTHQTAAAVVLGACAVLGAFAFFGLTPFGKTVVEQLAGSNQSAGATFNSAKVASIVMVPNAAGTNATSSSILNTDSTDRIITDAFVSCTKAGSVFAQTSAGVANWTWKAGTTTTSAPATLDSVNANSLAMSMNVATSATDDSYNSTSTYTGVFTRRWPTNTYLSFAPNATSSTAACVVGVHYLGS